MEPTERHYLSHLTHVNQHNKVLLSEDIYNDKGILVLKQGAEVNIDSAKKIAKHKLIKPLQESISLTEQLTYEKLTEIYTKHLQKIGLLEILNDTDTLYDVMASFHVLLKYPLVMQKLTVLENRMAGTLGRLIASSSLTIGLCRELNLPKDTIDNVFTAYMLTDIGLLHITPKVVNKGGKYTAEEWKLMQGHVVIAKHFADQVPDLPKAVGIALLEHHERIDGFGYPFGKKHNQLSIEGQIIAMCDKSSALEEKLVTNGPYCLKAVIDVMQVPSTAHAPEVHSAAMRVLKKLPTKYKPAFPLNEYKKLSRQCLEKRERLGFWFAEFSRIYKDHNKKMHDSESFQPFRLYKQLEHTISATGLVSESQDEWLSSLPKELSLHECSEIEEFSLVLNEIEYQCFFVLRTLAAAKEEFARRFGSADLPILYYRGLKSILTGSSR